MLAPTATINREQPLGPTDGDLHENLRPVLNMADRIGREVEQFAEELDKWDERRQKGEKRTAAIGLLDDCKKIAELTVKDLKKKYGSELSKRVGDVWTHRAQKLLNNQLDRKRDAEEIDKKFPKTPAIKDLERWQQEADTWELLQIILISNTSVYGSAAGFRKPINATINKLPNGEDVWEEFLGYNPVAKEQYLITKWLEATAEYTGNDLEIMAERLKESAGRNEATWSRGLLETRERIKSVKRLRPWSASELDSEIPIISNSTRNGQIVSSLDPDSKFRERLPLEGNDEFFERSLWLSCWELLRRGRPINEIREWCADRIENWRSVSLGPGTSADRQGMSRQEIFGRALWRRTCIMASKNTQASEYERAVYGLLGGNTSPVEAVCRNWNDLLYASFRTLLVDGFEDYARTHYPDEFPDALHRLPAEDNIRHFDQANPEMLSLAFIEDLLHEESVENEAKTPMKMMQGDFISHQFMTLVVRLGAALSDLESRGDQVWLEETSSDSLALQNPMLGMATDPNILRIMVHVVLILQGLDSAYLFDSIEQMQAADDIIIAYIEILKRSRKLQLIPLYASRLQRARPEMIVGRVLPVIETPKERHDYIGLLKSYDFNVLEVLTAQYESLLSEGILEKNDSRIFSLDLLEPTDSTLWPGQRVKSAFYRSELEDEEFAVIDSLEWFLLLDGHWVETFKILTKTLTTFLSKISWLFGAVNDVLKSTDISTIGQGRIASAVALCDRLPTKTISEIKTVMIFGAGIDIWSEENIEDLLQSLDSHRSSASRIRPFSPAAQQKLLSVLKSQSKTYRDLEMLVYALQALHDWRPEEDQVVE